MNEIDRQIGGLSSQLDRNTAELILATDNLAERNAVLERRLIDIYKRGQLYVYQVMLTVESFGDLVSRYKYLFLTSQQDRQLVGEVEAPAEPDRRPAEQRARGADAARPHQGRARGGAQALRHAGGRARQSGCRRSSGAPRTPTQQLSALEKDAARLTSLLATADKRRENETARAAARGVAPTRGILTTADLGKLDWPVQGTIVYRFGRDTLPSGGVIRWNGIGIGAPVGTPVKAVEGGQVGLVGNVGTYGLTVAVEHGNGYWSLYMQLQSAGGEAGRQGGAGTDGGDGGRRELRLRRRTCTSRSGARTRSRWTRRPGFGGGEREDVNRTVRTA